MAKNVTIAGAAFSAVPSIDVPQTGGGTASFFDVSDTTATAADVAQGKVFYAADGTETTGTASGGGGASNLVTGTFTTGGTGTSGSITVPYNGNGYPLFVNVTGVDGPFGGDFESLIARNATVLLSAIKKDFTSAPTYDGAETAENYAVVGYVNKSSTSDPSTGTGSEAAKAYYFFNTEPSRGNAKVICMSDATTIKWIVRTTTYGLIENSTYRYVIMYSE